MSKYQSLDDAILSRSMIDRVLQLIKKMEGKQ